ncbi:MAG: TIGR00296 family protein [Methanomassiliicoccales archaeon]|nr:MAG: TIGR00296 family protein [Methanomassiliicoccales archaeon]
MNDIEGQTAVRLARQAVEAEVTGGAGGDVFLPSSFQEKRGVFVTLEKYPEMDLRGCIGYPEPIYPLGAAIMRAAEAACHDPRFPSLKKHELTEIVVEVSILTPPEEIKVKDRKQLPEIVRVGIDGLIMERGPFRGLLLPQVPVEWKWDATTFLEQTCIKAGLTPDRWLDPGCRVYRFQAEIFAEEAPKGRISRKELK